MAHSTYWLRQIAPGLKLVLRSDNGGPARVIGHMKRRNFRCGSGWNTQYDIFMRKRPEQAMAHWAVGPYAPRSLPSARRYAARIDCKSGK